MFLAQLEIQVVATDNATRFFDRSSLPVRVFCDVDEWQVDHSFTHFFSVKIMLSISLTVS